MSVEDSAKTQTGMLIYILYFNCSVFYYPVAFRFFLFAEKT